MLSIQKLVKIHNILGPLQLGRTLKYLISMDWTFLIFNFQSLAENSQNLNWNYRLCQWWDLSSLETRFGPLEIFVFDLLLNFFFSITEFPQSHLFTNLVPLLINLKIGSKPAPNWFKPVQLNWFKDQFKKLTFNFLILNPDIKFSSSVITSRGLTTLKRLKESPIIYLIL